MDERTDPLKFVSVTDPNISYVLAPWYITDFENVVEIGQELHHRLTYNPDETLVLIAHIDGQIKAYAIAYVRAKDVFIWQAKAVPGFGPNKAMFGMIELWARHKGFNKLSAQSKRRRGLCRLFGFRPSGTDELIKEI